MLNQLKDVFLCFQKHEVRYLVIDGIAAVLYGVPRDDQDSSRYLLPTTNHVFIVPLPLISIVPRGLVMNVPAISSFVRSLTWMKSATPWDSIRLATLTGSPQMS